MHAATPGPNFAEMVGTESHLAVQASPPPFSGHGQGLSSRTWASNYSHEKTWDSQREWPTYVSCSQVTQGVRRAGAQGDQSHHVSLLYPVWGGCRLLTVGLPWLAQTPPPGDYEGNCGWDCRTLHGYP